MYRPNLTPDEYYVQHYKQALALLLTGRIPTNTAISYLRVAKLKSSLNMKSRCVRFNHIVRFTLSSNRQRTSELCRSIYTPYPGILISVSLHSDSATAHVRWEMGDNSGKFYELSLFDVRTKRTRLIYKLPEQMNLVLGNTLIVKPTG